MAAFNEHVEHTANGWGPPLPGSLVTTHTANPPAPATILGKPVVFTDAVLASGAVFGPALYQCCVCGAGPMPFEAFPRFMSIRVCGRCYPLGYCDSLRRV